MRNRLIAAPERMDPVQISVAAKPKTAVPPPRVHTLRMVDGAVDALYQHGCQAQHWAHDRVSGLLVRLAVIFHAILLVDECDSDAVCLRER